MDKTEYTTIALAMSKNNSNNILRHTIPYTYHKKGVPEKWGYPLNSPLQVILLLNTMGFGHHNVQKSRYMSIHVNIFGFPTLLHFKAALGPGLRRHL